MRHFLKETDIPAAALPELFRSAGRFKAARGRMHPRPLEGQSWGLLFNKKSTRTRVSFQVALYELGAQAVWLDEASTQLGRGESVADTARVLSRYLHGLVIRTYGQELIESFAREGSVPVVNALTDLLHPCQIFADVMTMAEKRGSLEDLQSLGNLKLVFLGDTACNMANSWLMAGKLFGIEVVLSGPPAYAPGPEIRSLLREAFNDDTLVFEPDPRKAVEGADFVYTDVWVSMGAESDESERLALMKPYAVTTDLMQCAGADACFLHCMPAHPDSEVSQEVLDSPRAILFDQAENRLHMQKAILAHLASGAR